MILTAFDYLALLSPSIREKPRFTALVSAVLSQAADLFSLVEDLLPAAFSPASAEGFQLDTLGELAGVPRPGQFTSDEDYRVFLTARTALNRWSGSNGDIPSVLAAAFRGREARLLDNQDGTVTAVLPGGAPFPPAALFPVPAGVRLIEA